MRISELTEHRQSKVTEISANTISKKIQLPAFVYAGEIKPIPGFGHISGTGLNGKPMNFAVKLRPASSSYLILLPAPKIKLQYINLAAQIMAFTEMKDFYQVNFSEINVATNTEQLQSALSQQRNKLGERDPDFERNFLWSVKDATVNLKTRVFPIAHRWPWMLSTSANTANFASNKPADYIKVGRMEYETANIALESDKVIPSVIVESASVDSAYQGQSLMWALYYGLIIHTGRNLMSHGSHSPGAAKTWSRLGESSGVRIWALDGYPRYINSRVYPTISTETELKTTINGRVKSVYKHSVELTLLAVSRGSEADKLLENIANETQQREKPSKKPPSIPSTTEVDEEQNQISEPLTDTTGLSSWRGFCPVAE